MDTINRLQFRHHEEIFEDRCKAIEYIYDKIKENGAGLASEQNSPYGYSLFAEPTILRYKNEDDEVHDCKGDETCTFKKGPHLMLVIGSETNDTIYHDRNRFCVIDIDKTEEDIKNLEEELEKAIRSLTIIALNSDTLNLYADKTEDGTIVSGDVKTAETHVFEDIVKENNLMIVPTDDPAGPEGLFIYVDLTYDEATETFTFVVTNSDGTLKKQSVKLPNNYLVSGEYKKEDESIHLHMRNGDEVIVDCEQLIDEWKVEGEASNTPIVLTREEVGPDEDHHHTEPWQDILRADVRVANFINTNILEKTTDGRYLYVDGKATNILYYYNGERSNVSEQLDKLNKIKVSADNDNIIWNRTDGFFASAKLDYITNKNKLVFTTSTVSGGTLTKEIQLNSVELFQNIYYDRNTEELVITYKDSEGNLKVVRIPISDMFQEWDVLNDAHSVKLVKSPHHVAGKDILTADVNISAADNNILEERGEGNVHALFVRGTSDNIKYDYTGDTTVKDVLDDLKEEGQTLNEKIDNEIARAEAAEHELDGKIDQEIADRTSEVGRIDITIGSGFSTDSHETVTYKFEQLTEKVDNEIDRATAAETRIETKLDNEIARSTSEDERIDAKLDDEIARSTAEDEKIETTIGSGFSTDAHETVTYKFDQLQEQVNSEADKLQNEINRSEAKDTEHDGRLNAIDAEIGDGFGPRATVRDAIDTLSADTAASLKDVINNDKSIDVDRTDPVRPVIKVNLSGNEPYNTLRLEGDGLYNFIDLNYDPDTNKLTLTRSDNGSTENVSKELQLNSVSIIDGMEYDPTTETLIIKYHSGSEQKELRIPLGEIFQEWEVYNNPDSAVKLNRQRVIDGKDKLSGEVIITSAHTDNIIENDHGALYVPANTDVTRALSGAITQEIQDRISGDGALEDAIQNEATDRQLADAALSAFTITAVNEEKTRAMTAEGALQNAIVAEKERAEAADSILRADIDREVARSTEKDNIHDAKIAALENSATTLEHSIETERTRALSAETELSTRITNVNNSLENEVTRSTNKDIEHDTAVYNLGLSAHSLSDRILQEAADRDIADASLRELINTEKSDRIAQDTVIIERLANEINRSTAEDDRLNAALQQEINDRTSGDAELEQAIRDATLTFKNTVTTKMNKSEANEVTTDVIVPIDNNIIVVDEGLKAYVRLDYNEGTNTLVLEKTSASGTSYDTVQLNAGSIINSITYDDDKKELVIRYTSTSDPEHKELEVRVSVSDLFNPWIVQEGHEGAILLHKEISGGTGGADVLHAEVVIAPYSGSTADNAIENIRGALYVKDRGGDIDCVKNEVKVFEKTVIGHIIDEECGGDYTYEPNRLTTYINSATSFNDADVILDNSIKNVENKVDIISAKTECVSGRTDAIYKAAFGEPVPDGCGETIKYVPDTLSCVISGATSLYDADRLMAYQICEILEMWVSGMTCTSVSNWVDEGANKKMLVDVRASAGNNMSMTDDDLYITNLTGKTIESGITEFTDTNVLRIVCLNEGPVIPDVSTPQNGIYLSNVWNCGKYYQVSTEAEEMAEVEASGYKVEDYTTDENASASNYNYMNNVRQSDI